ncbi:MAG: AAA family ATPase [Candidatus Aenigmatarchaeota archaeon]
MSQIVAVVGMPASGKSEAVKVFEKNGFSRVYFGKPVFDRLEKEGLEVNEENERKIREKMREEGGMAVMAKKCLPKIDEKLKKGNVVIESLYSWEEYKLLKKKYGDKFQVLAIYSSPRTRYKRLKKRKDRKLTKKEAKNRDYSQIENLHTPGPIAIADFTIVNEGSLKDFKKYVEELVSYY